MSSREAEQEHGPLVVLLLPALLGGITLLLARRWVSGNSTNALHTTAVSRRRRILKDPLARRTIPPPVNQQKMLTNKRTTNPVTPVAGRKFSIEEDISVSFAGRRPARSPRFPASPGAQDASTEMPAPPSPKHIPFPAVPVDSELLFEAMTFVFTSVAAGLQFLNLYRTVWWLPHSHTSQAMNFYLIDTNVVSFIIILLSRRLLMSGTMAFLRSVLTPRLMASLSVCIRMFILGVVLGALAWCTYFIVLKHPIVKVFFLCYPIIIYFAFFGLESGPFLELSNSDRPLLHCCYPTANGVRNEVDLLRTDFNMRVKKVIFGSFIGAYYTSFIPCCFAQPFLYYDVYAATQQMALVWAGLFTRYASQNLNSYYCDSLHRAAKHLGAWKMVAKDPNVQPMAWCPHTLWSYGTRVMAPDGAIYQALGPVNAAEPNNLSHVRFYGVFQNPSMLLCLLLCSQLSLILLQLVLLFSSSHWHCFLSLSLLLFINYYTLFKLVRDYLITWKVYRAEFMIQGKTTT